MSLQNKSNQRLLSLDALRGFDMIWLLGAEGLFTALLTATGFSFWQVIAKQFEHSTWHGFTFYDLIFPLFIFLSGVTLGINNTVFSNFTYSQKIDRYKKAAIRLIILCLLGIIYNHGWGQGVPTEPEKIRYVSVLMRIGFSWFICAMIVWHFKLKIQLWICVSILIGYWVLLMFIPTPEGNVGDLSPTGSWNSWIDRYFLPGVSYKNLATDPEGILSQLPAIATAMIGVFAGKILVIKNSTDNERLCYLLLGSLIVFLFGYLWSFSFPLNKVLWTSSFVLITAGYSGGLLCLFYWLFDILCYRKTGVFFAIIGANSILLYLLTSLFDWTFLTNSLIGNISSIFGDNWKAFVLITFTVLMQWLFANILYKNKIFIKI